MLQSLARFDPKAMFEYEAIVNSSRGSEAAADEIWSWPDARQNVVLE